MIRADEDRYYQISHISAISNKKHPGFILLKNIAKTSQKILDVGCGEGTHLNQFTRKKSIGIGIDINRFAIKLAAKHYPNHRFKLFNGQNIPFPDNHFDLVYSTFILEHTRCPEKILTEMVRVLEPNGNLIIICPNYGSPNRRSPNSTIYPIYKLFTGFIFDYILLLKKSIISLNWTKVIPKKRYLNIDDDTTVEPYIHSLIKYLIGLKIQIIKQSSLWDLEDTQNTLKQFIAHLGKNSIFPFFYYGPQILIFGKKIK